MKNFFIAFIVFLVWSIFGLWLYSLLKPTNLPNKLTAQDSVLVEKEEQLPEVDSVSVNPSIRDTLNLEENTGMEEDSLHLDTGLKAQTADGDIIFYFEEGIQIQKNNPTPVIPSSLVDFKYKLNTYILEHPNKELQITALYDASENIITPNLGTQRGNTIRKILLEAGMPKEKVYVQSTIKEINFDENNFFKNGISFNFKELDSSRVEMSKFYLPETKTIYPKFINNDIFVNEALKLLLEEAKTILSSNPNAKLEIIGHTDNIGNANDNYLLALQYARQVRWYLVSKGNLDKNRIIAASEGEAKSIANNATERGRFLNRRIEVKYFTD